MKNQLFWNGAELRLRAGWRILIQIMMISLPLAIFALFGLYSSGNLAIKMTATVLPITLLSILILGKFIDKRANSDYGVQLKQKKWWFDYGFGWLAGFLAASCYAGLFVLFGWANVTFSGKLTADPATFVMAMFISLLAYAGVGVFEEILRTYQIRNITEGFAETKTGMTGAMILAVILAGFYSVLMHLASKDLPFLVYVMVTGLIYGLFFLWTERAALAMAMHFAWDFTVSNIFQIGSVSEASFFIVRIEEMPNSGFEILPMAGINAKSIGLILILFWIKKREGKIVSHKEIGRPTLS